MHLEWWSALWFGDQYQFSSITTCLFWVFNQAIVPWCITLCVMQEKKLCNLAVLGILALPFGPLPFLGIFIMCIIKGLFELKDAIKRRQLSDFCKDIFSIQNICAIVAILPVYYFYYSSNSATTSADGGVTLYLMKKWNLNLGLELKHVIFFWLVEFGVYAIIVFKNYRKDSLFYGALITSIVAPVFAIGTANTGDFTMRVSIPCILFLAAAVVKYIFNEVKAKAITEKKFSFSLAALAAIMIIGMMTPVTEFWRGIKQVEENGYESRLIDPYYTIDNPNNKFIENFVCWNPQNSIFFKFLCESDIDL